MERELIQDITLSVNPDLLIIKKALIKGAFFVKESFLTRCFLGGPDALTKFSGEAEGDGQA